MRPQISIGAVIKNEGPYLLEWLAWHLSIGIDHFYIADNNSSDGTTQLLQELGKLGFLTHIEFPNKDGGPPQLGAYRLIADKAAGCADWIAFIDADEFLHPMGGKEIHHLMEEAPNDVGAIAVNWAIYGSSGHDKPIAGGVIDRFTFRAEKCAGVNRHYKSIVRLMALDSTSGNPHHFNLKNGYRYTTPEYRSFEFLPTIGKGASAVATWETLRLNHYVVKSWAEFWAKKASRGRATITTERRNSNFFVDHDKNNVKDVLPLEARLAVREKVANFTNANSRIGELSRRLADSLLSLKIDSSYGQRPKIQIKIDTKSYSEGTLRVAGWAHDSFSGQPASELTLAVNGSEIATEFVRRQRKDVVRSQTFCALDVGWIFEVDYHWDGAANEFEITVGDGGGASARATVSVPPDDNHD